MTIRQVQSSAVSGQTKLIGIELQNFKSIKSARVRIRPLTIIAGVNSAGKSSLLQSILALTQVSRRRIDGNQFPLNDELAMLGTFSALKHQRAETFEPLRISLRFSSRRRNVLRHAAPLRESALRSGEEPDERLVVNWAIELDAQAGLQIGSAQISAIEVSIDSPDLFCRMTRESDYPEQGDLVQPTEEFEAKFSGSIYRHTIRESGSYIGTSQTRMSDARIISGQLTSFFVERDDPEQLVNEWFEEAELESFDPDDMPDTKVDSRELVEVAVNSIIAGSPPATHPDILHQISCLNVQARQSLKNDVLGVLREVSSVNPLRRDDSVEGSHLVGAQRTCSRYLANSVNYIGPLRHAPHLPFRSAPDPDSDSVGTAGEHVAAVLQAKGHIKRQYPLPDNRSKSLTLLEAVDEWLSFFGLSDSLSVHEGTPLVYSINLQPPGLDDSVALNAVGVGVSQVLPIIVQCLVAGPGAMTLLEQPELHLHPAAQQRLADFFVACINWGQSILVESHSEYLVLRLRRRIAEDHSDLLREQTSIYFAERDQTGDTAFRTVSLTEVGGVVEWPEGFFDQGQSEAHQLLIAAAARGQAKDQGEADIPFSEAELSRLKRRFKTRHRDKGRLLTARSFPLFEDAADDEEIDVDEMERRFAEEQERLRALRKEQSGLSRRDSNTFDSPIDIHGIVVSNVSDLEDLASFASNDRSARQIIRRAIQALESGPSAEEMLKRLQNLLDWYS